MFGRTGRESTTRFNPPADRGQRRLIANQQPPVEVIGNNDRAPGTADPRRIARFGVSRRLGHWTRIVHREIDDEFVRVRIEPSRRVIAPFLAVLDFSDQIRVGGEHALVLTGLSFKEQPNIAGIQSSKKLGDRIMSNREEIAPNGDTRYIWRDDQGRIKTSVEEGRSLSDDAHHKAKTDVKPDQGYRGYHHAK